MDSKKTESMPFAKERTRLPKEQWPRQNLPIKNETKIKRVYQKEPIDESCWAFMKLLRETNKTKKLYDVNPYAEVYQFRENMYGLLIESADGMGDAWMYLTIGPEKALLVDTGFGIGDLKGLVNEITGDMPLIVVNTHGHFDHAYGNCQFDRVYCHKYEAPSLISQNEHIWDYLFEDNGRCIWAEFDRNDIVPFKEYEIVACPDGYIFNLGGDYEVELMFMGGHSPGHAGYLDKKNRILFAGDDIISMRVGVGNARPGMPFGEYTKVTSFRNQLEKIVKRIDEFDHVFPGHFICDLESSVVANMLKACNEVITDPENSYTSVRETPRGITYTKYVEGLGVLSYPAIGI